MGEISVLKDDVINKIAAGEVVERPASVIKELVENAIDAKATEIVVEIGGGGIESIVVTDNGVGMDEDDLENCVLRHATSKIKSAEDLWKVGSMGFRGEALASIAAVSRFSVASVRRGQTEGKKLHVDGGSVQPSQIWVGAEGTQIVVEDLFYNIPARRKFLKSESIEASYIAEILQLLAIAHPKVGITLVKKGSSRGDSFRVYADEEARTENEICLKKRLKEVFPKENIDSTLYVSGRSAYGSFTGLVSAPGIEKHNSKYIRLFVNGRSVQDKGLRYAVMRGFHSHLLKGKFPFAVIHIDIPTELVDVNVHPAKTEVRLQYAKEIQDLISSEIRKVLRQGDWAAPKQTEFGANAGFAPRPSFPSSRASFASFSRSNSTADFSFQPQAASNFSATSDFSVSKPSDLDKFLTEETFITTSESASTKDQIVEATIPWGELEYIGAFDRCYLMFEHKNQLLVVDQHAFHERILFERLCNDETLLNQSQPLLVPEEVLMDALSVDTLKVAKEDLCKRGFDFNVTAEDAIEVLAVPSLLSGKPLDQLFCDLAHPYTETTDNAEQARLILATIACHSAVRAGEDLSENDLVQLLSQASEVDFYHNCPHGRRVFKWWTTREVSKWFDRT